uniref:Peptidase S26 domain-containing protein n=1 Tax=Aegilops tauschii subsp. strangulata TaxID=200361 RepID=A0A453DMH9_AEGTS
MFGRPSVGDIVFFRVPTALQNCGISKDVVFIKRVIAVLIETSSRVRQGQLIVNGVAQNEHYTAPHASYTMEAMEEDQKWHGCSVLLTS